MTDCVSIPRVLRFTYDIDMPYLALLCSMLQPVWPPLVGRENSED